MVGKTGAGKSTILNLIPRFYDTVDGEILIDKKNIKNISKFVRKNIPKDCQQILTKGINIINEKCTDPNKININKTPTVMANA